jgi:predicted Zn-dependent protease with MMP-like domain
VYLTTAEFERIIAGAIDSIPDEFKDVLSKNQIAVIARSRVPSPVRKQYRGQTVFGIFIGVPYGRFNVLQTEPTRIELYKESFEQYFSTEREIKQQIRRTVLHEVGHYFGFSEAEIRKLEL